MQLLATVQVTRRRRNQSATRPELTIRRLAGGVALVVDLGHAAWTRRATSPAELQRAVDQVVRQVWGAS
jgi:hypothetical protein